MPSSPWNLLDDRRSLAFGAVGPLPTFVKAETPVRESLGAGLAATRLEAAVDGNVLVPHVEVAGVVGFCQEGAEDDGAPRVGRPHNVVALMIVERGFVIDVAAIRVRDRAKYACVVIEHQACLQCATTSRYLARHSRARIVQRTHRSHRADVRQSR